MILACFVLAAVTLAMSAFPDTRTGRTLRRWLVERPAEALSRLGAGRAMALTLFLLFGLLLFELGEAEGLRLFFMFVPEALPWIVAFDAGLLLDMTIIAMAAGGAARLRAVRDQLVGAVAHVATPIRQHASRAGRAVRTVMKRLRPGRTDEGDRPRPAFGRGSAFGPQPAFG